MDRIRLQSVFFSLMNYSFHIICFLVMNQMFPSYVSKLNIAFPNPIYLKAYLKLKVMFPNGYLSFEVYSKISNYELIFQSDVSKVNYNLL